MDKIPNFLVTVRCMTYQQADYVLDAVQSIVMQETTFPFLILIVDDASTDGTAQIIRRYVEEEFCVNDLKNSWHNQDEDTDSLFARHRTKKNCYVISMNLKHNLYHDFPKKHKLFAKWLECSKYIAICDGDDYWISRHKLQKQVDFLETHSDYQLVFHNAIVHYEDSHIPDRLMQSFQTGRFTTAQIFEYWQLQFSSIVYRLEIEDADLFKELSMNLPKDRARFVAASMLGNVYGMSDCLSVYRINNNGVTKAMLQAQFIYNGCEMAKRTTDKDAIESQRQFVIRTLIKNMPDIIRRKERMQGLWETAKRYYHSAPYLALGIYLKNSLVNMLKKPFTWIKSALIK